MDVLLHDSYTGVGSFLFGHGDRVAAPSIRSWQRSAPATVVAVGAAASRMQATAQQTLGAATRPCLRSRLRGCTKTEPFLCRKVRLVASLPVSFCRSLWYTCFARGGNAAALPGKAGVNQPTNGRSVLAGASVRMARTSGTIS